MILIYGLITGVIFGFLLQRSRVIRYDKQISALLLKDMTIVKFMLSAILVGMIGIYLLKGAGMVKLNVKATILGGNIIGGLIFGIGWGLLGYCPGTQAGALAEGRYDAIWGVIGMIVGSMLFAEAYPFLNRTVLTWGILGKVTIPQITALNPWLVIPFIVWGCIMLFIWFDKKGL